MQLCLEKNCKHLHQKLLVLILCLYMLRQKKFLSKDKVLRQWKKYSMQMRLEQLRVKCCTPVLMFVLP